MFFDIKHQMRTSSRAFLQALILFENLLDAKIACNMQCGFMNPISNPTRRFTFSRLYACAIVFFLSACAFECFVFAAQQNPTQTNSAWSLAEMGLEYEMRILKEPRLIRAHILQVNMKDEKLRLTMLAANDPDGDGPANAALTDPRVLASGQDLLAFVNTNPWEGLKNEFGKRDRAWREGQPVIITGWAVSNGIVRNPPMRGTGALWVDSKGSLFMGRPSASNDVPAMAFEGWGQNVAEGNVLGQPRGEPAPRTGIGIDRDAGVLWIVVVDGRQRGFSEGMTSYELGEFMRDLGCWTASNMDGGGSSVLGLRQANGAWKIMNRPSDRFLTLVRVRPLPLVLGIRRAGIRLPSQGLKAKDK